MPARLNDPVYRHRTVQVLVDAALVGLAYFLAYLLRFDQGIPERYRELLGDTIAFVIVGKVAIFAAFGLYNKWWRYVGLRDLESIFKAVVTASLVLVGLLFVWSPTDNDLPRSIAVMDLLLTAALVGGARLVVRSVLERPPRGSVLTKGREILIVGAGEAGQLVSREMQRSPELGQTPIGFIDDDPRKRGMRIHDLKVLGTTDKMARLLDDVEPDEVIIAIPSAPGVLREKVVRACRERDIPVRTLPGVFELISGSVNLMRQVREVRVEDVLGRDPVPFEIERAGSWLRDRTVLVTGAGGSIGSELCRQIARVRPRVLVMVDHAEDNLFEIERELLHDRHFTGCESILADCKEPERMQEVMRRFRPEVVFHAAAYKHVSLTEDNPARGGSQQRDRDEGLRDRRGRGRRGHLPARLDGQGGQAGDGARRIEGDGRVDRRGARAPVRGHDLLLRAVRQRPRVERERRAALPPADRAGRPGDGHPPRHGALLHDGPRGGPAHHPRRQHRARRRGLRARDGRSGEDHRSRAEHDPPLGSGRPSATSRSRSSVRAPARSCAKSFSTKASARCRPTPTGS